MWGGKYSIGSLITKYVSFLKGTVSHGLLLAEYLLSISRHTLSEAGRKVIFTSQYVSHVQSIIVYCIGGYGGGGSEKPEAGQATQSTAKANHIWLVEMRLSISHHSLYETGSKVFSLQHKKYPLPSTRKI